MAKYDDDHQSDDNAVNSADTPLPPAHNTASSRRNPARSARFEGTYEDKAESPERKMERTGTPKQRPKKSGRRSESDDEYGKKKKKKSKNSKPKEMPVKKEPVKKEPNDETEIIVNAPFSATIQVTDNNRDTTASPASTKDFKLVFPIAVPTNVPQTTDEPIVYGPNGRPLRECRRLKKVKYEDSEDDEVEKEIKMKKKSKIPPTVRTTKKDATATAARATKTTAATPTVATTTTTTTATTATTSTPSCSTSMTPANIPAFAFNPAMNQLTNSAAATTVIYPPTLPTSLATLNPLPTTNLAVPTTALLTPFPNSHSGTASCASPAVTAQNVATVTPTPDAATIVRPVPTVPFTIPPVAPLMTPATVPASPYFTWALANWLARNQLAAAATIPTPSAFNPDPRANPTAQLMTPATIPALAFNPAMNQLLYPQIPPTLPFSFVEQMREFRNFCVGVGTAIHSSASEDMPPM